MLDRIEIRNFKAIQDGKGESGNVIEKPLILENLAQVNYLVGKNGSGKSSVLEAIHLFWLSKNSDTCSERFQKVKTTMKYEKKSEFVFQIEKKHNELKIEVSKELIINKLNISDKLFRKKTDLIYLTSHPKWINFELYEFCLKCPVYDNIRNMNEVGNFFGLLGNYGILFNQFSFSNIPQIASALNCNKKFTKLVNSFIYKYSGLSSAKELHIKIAKNKVGDVYFNNKNSYEEGKIYLSNLIYACIGDTLGSNNEYNKIILIEEPENHIHPDKQKHIPCIIHEISKELNSIGVKTQFIISTHSPFIISAAAKLDDQKVYLIEEGVCTNPQGSEKGGAKLQALKMLGAGLEDFIPKRIIVCEGGVNDETTGYQHDANIYNELFGHLEDVGFYSGGGSSEIIPGGTKMKDLINILGGLESQFLVLVESDEFDNQKNRLKSEYHLDEKMIINTGLFQEIEDFLYHDNVLKYLKNNLNLDVEANAFNSKHKDEWWNNNSDKLGSINITDSSNVSRKKFELYLAKIIREEFGKKEFEGFEDNIYWQLYTSIFT